MPEAAHKPLAAIDETGQSHPPTQLAGRSVLAFCGLGSPKHFFESLAGLGAKIVGIVELNDHEAYNEGLLANLADLAKREGAEIMVTTQKDHVRLAHLALPKGAPIWQLAIEMAVTAGRGELLARIARAVSPGG